ncbi:hypothetical protein EVAR_38625_1 [Eumeta japonica]|uniref:Uncharacterized protein n=1 Tax=Eumeta variegata TaxID=151549 RepID=A0A4C1Y1F7_EUMVA|nr:hypothetical protein EVAR_38625_1 [Eumeta japonica]
MKRYKEARSLKRTSLRDSEKRKRFRARGIILHTYIDKYYIHISINESSAPPGSAYESGPRRRPRASLADVRSRIRLNILMRSWSD